MVDGCGIFLLRGYDWCLLHLHGGEDAVDGVADLVAQKGDVA